MAAVKRAKNPPDRPNRPASISGASQAAVMMRCLSTLLRLDLFVGHAEAPLAPLEVLQRQVEGVGVEVGPQAWREVELGVGQLPENEVGDALLAAGADAEIHRRHPGQAQLGSEGGLVDGLGIHLAGGHPLGEAARRPGQVPLAAIVGGDHQVQPGVVAGLGLGPGDVLLDRVREGREITDHREPDAVLVELADLALQRQQEQLHQGADLGPGTLPVLAGEGEQGEGLDPALGGAADGGAHRLHAGMVATHAGEAARPRPAVVAVHGRIFLLRMYCG